MKPASAPSGGRTATPRPVRAAGAPARSHIPFAPRRVSGPVKRPQNRPLTRPPGRPEEPFRARATSAVAASLRSLPDHRWLDRLVRGRAWIPLLGVLLAGIVATQVEVLKLGASMGRWVSRSAALTSRNQALQASVAALSDDQRIERRAAQMGMVMPAPTDVTFVPLRPGGGMQAALGHIRVPDAAQFQAALAASQAAALAQAAPTIAPTVAPGTSTSLTSQAAAPTSGTPVAPTSTTQPGATSTTPMSTSTTPASTTTSVTTPAPATPTAGAPTQPTTTAQPTGGATPPSVGGQTGG